MGLGSIRPGERVGPYRILRPLGEGGMGRVLLALDERLGRHVALKVLSGPLADDPVARERLLREAKAVSRITHPNVAALYDIGERDGDVYLAMEFVEGETLSRRIERGPLPVADLVTIGIQVADALEAAHGQGVVHRDIKPGNVLLKTDGSVKVVDFGLAMRMEMPPGSLPSEPSDGPDTRITRTGYTAGTISYMSPEQARGEIPRFPSDLFSLGIVLYEAATGLLPFSRSSPLATAASILRDDPRPMKSLRPEVPSAFVETVGRCLEKDPAKRPVSAAAVAAALRLVDAGHSSRAIRKALGPAQPVWPKVAAAVGITALAAFVVFRIVTGGDDVDIRNEEARKLWEQSVAYDARGTSRENLEHAAALARAALDREPGNPVLEAHLAYQLARLQLEDHDPGHTAEIEALAAKALASEEDLPEAWFARGWRQTLSEEFEGAAESARRGKDLAPHRWPGYVIGGRALLRLGKTEEGLEELKRGLEVEGGDVFTRTALAYELILLGRIDNAAAEFRRVLDYAPDFPVALTNLGGIYVMQGRYLDAIPIYQRLLRAQPNADAASNLGTAYFFLDRMPEAIREYERAIELAPHDPAHKRNLADAYEKTGRFEDARRYYEAGISDCERRSAGGTADSGTRSLRALLLAKTGRTAEALREIDALSASSPQDMLVHFAAAQVHAVAGDRTGTFEHARAALDLGYPRDLFRSDPYFGNLRTDPEFLDLLSR